MLNFYILISINIGQKIDLDIGAFLSDNSTI